MSKSILDILDEAEKYVSANKEPCRYCDWGYEDAECECFEYLHYKSKLDSLVEQNIRALIDIAKAADRFYKSRAILENQKEVDWDAFELLGEALSKLRGDE